MDTQSLVTEKAKLEIKEAVNYISNVANKQGSLPDCKLLFGDGARWKNLWYAWFEIVYKAVENEINCKGGFMNNKVLAGKVEHTPMPWLNEGSIIEHKDNNNNVDMLLDLSASEHSINLNTDKANASFIIKAVNCHKKLLETLEMVRGMIVLGKPISEPLMLIDNAIAKAEGK